jgi:hypothetical protein
LNRLGGGILRAEICEPLHKTKGSISDFLSLPFSMLYKGITKHVAYTHVYVLHASVML